MVYLAQRVEWGPSALGEMGLFEPFQFTKPNGYGLGLFAARHILEMHKGSVEVQSVEGEGTHITVRLPADLSSDDGLEQKIIW